MAQKQLLYFFVIGILNLLLFLGIFSLLQNESIYKNSLGLFSKNYENVSDENNFNIIRNSVPYLEIKNNSFEIWDAAIYKAIREKMYIQEDKDYGNVRSAFFPLFPLMWKITSVSAIGISLINYFIFIISVAILILLFSEHKNFEKILIFAVLISFPSSIIFYIPYSEALFMLSGTVMFAGIKKQKYWLFFTGAFLISLVRPATIFILMAFVITEVLIFIKSRNVLQSVKSVLSRITPFLIGYFTVFIIQFSYSGNWHSFFDAHSQWNAGLKPIKGIADWSFESFGLTSFALFFVCIPLLFFMIMSVFRKKSPVQALVADAKKDIISYIFQVSSFYIIGIFIFTLLSSGGNFHSFYRFILATPLFYTLVIIYLNRIGKTPSKSTLLGLISSIVLLIIFFTLVAYGGSRIDFAYAGLYAFILTYFFLLFHKKFNFTVQVALILIVVILNTVWNTYLFNIFLSNGWVFT